MPRSLAVIALFALFSLAPAAATPPFASGVHPAASAHATAMAGQAGAMRIEACVHASNAFLDDLAKADYKAATDNFDAKMQGFGSEKLAAAWQSIATRYGKLESRSAPQNVMYQDYVVVTVPLHFAKGDLGARLACDASGKFAGFHIVPATTAPSASQ
ncbi:MAG: DUF3887 domain-containing protein [Rhodanobacteraceae bacterium]